MKKTGIAKKTGFKTGLIFLLLVTGLLLHFSVGAQIEVDSAKILMNSNLKFDTTATGFINKIKQPIQFRGKRNKRENQRIYEFMLERIQKGELKIDTNTVKDIINQLDHVNFSTAINSDSIKKINVEIDSIIVKNNLKAKASKEVIDSLKIQMSAVIQENAAITNQGKKDFINSIGENLNEIQKVRYSQASNKSVTDSIIIDSTKYHIKRWLTPKIKIIGWYNPWLTENEHKRYNYNYLSAVNVLGYELNPNGEALNQAFLTKIQEPGEIIKHAQENGCDVYFTVYSKRPADISKFLNSNTAQDALLEALHSLIVENHLKGVNVYFEGMNNTHAEKFSRFMVKLKETLVATESSVLLMLSLPAVIDNSTLKEIDAYRLNELDQMVDFYQVLTDRIIMPNVKTAQAASPLFSSNKYQNRSVEATIGTYLQLGIEPSKLVMTVSYLGIEWQVKDFSGTLKSGWKKEIKYAEIIKKYPLGTVGDITVTEGFDPDQSTPFLNITDPKSENLKQIWYEDAQSLYLKYIWALEQGLGGVALKNPGYDDGHPGLWNALGASLIQIDTFRMDSVSIKMPVQEKKIRFPMLTYALKGFKFKTFIQDFKWATVVRLKYDSVYVDPVYIEPTKDTIKFFRYSKIDSLKKVIAIEDYLRKKIIWDEVVAMDEANTQFGEHFLKNSSYCYSLYARWTIYAKFFKWNSLFFAIITVIIWMFSFNSERYLVGKENVRSIIRMLPVVFMLITVLHVSFWLYFDPYFTSFGAGSENGTNNLILIYSVILGIFVGGFVTYRYVKYKSS